MIVNVYLIGVKPLLVFLGGGVGLPVLCYERLELLLPRFLCERGHLAHAVLVGLERYCGSTVRKQEQSAENCDFYLHFFWLSGLGGQVKQELVFVFFVCLKIIKGKKIIYIYRYRFFNTQNTEPFYGVNYRILKLFVAR